MNSTPKILIVEDSPTQAQRLQHILEQQGYQVTAAANGQQALAVARAHRPDLIVSDVVMPEMDGYELCRQIKADPRLGELPVILVTTLSDPEDVIRGLACRADHFILKPYDERYLLGRVQFVLVNREMRQNEQPGMGLEIFFNGQRHFITADRLQILNLLLSTYEAAIHRNKELTNTQESLREANSTLQRLTRDLEDRVLARTRELEKMNEDLKQSQQSAMQQERLRALGQMASGIAHDINNAISPVTLYAESLLEKEPNLSARTRQYLQTIQQAVADVAATVTRMREFYRPREPELLLAPVDLNLAFQQVTDLTRARWYDMAQRRGAPIELRSELVPELPAVMAVENEIRDALTNLIFNAVDAMPEGGMLTLRTQILAAAADSSPRVLLEVSDTGIGMDESTRRQCLEPFFTTKGERGTGLGLAMVYGMVRRHSADIEIASAPGRGTTVRLIFAAPDLTAAALPETITVLIPPTGLRILIVDDDPILLETLQNTLESDGHTIVTATGGQKGIDTFRVSMDRDQAFSVVITDLGMPNVDGRKVASFIKSVAPSTPVILLTGWGQKMIAEGDVPAHVDLVLSKPPRLRQLREALAQCCASAS
jgi:signal transduction histidine kinase